MNKTWFCYVTLSIGLMLLSASDNNLSANDTKSAHTVDFITDKKVEVIVNKDGNNDSVVKVIVDGKNYDFTMPELADGEDRTFTTDEGQEITIKSLGGAKMILIGDEKLHLPSLGKHRISAEGLSAMIGSSHHFQLSNDVTISSAGMSDEVQAAVLEAVKGVLASYNVDKKVSFNEGISKGDFDVKIIQLHKNVDDNTVIELIEEN